MAEDKGNSVNKWFSSNVSEDIAKALIKVNVKVQDESGKTIIISKDFRPDVDINYENLERQLSEAPSLFAYWAMVMSEQKTVVGVLERKIKRRRAVATNQVVRQAKNEGVVLKVDDVKSLVEMDDELELLEAELLIAERTSGKLWNIVEALKMKSENLRSLSGFKKQEMKDAPH
jgi:transcriptional regulator with PAS, ATPase and Fis domain